ncbi:MAG: DUF2085 domain-containing protein [Anaerolineae bacterium]|nr:DUF2085 domain-containing protein [Anaerolineae bacterium]
MENADHKPQMMQRSRLDQVVLIVALVIIAGFLLAPPWHPLDKADLIGSGICHRIPDHSLFLGGRQLPLCARCTGTYLGALLGFATMWALRRQRATEMPPTPVLVAAVAFIAIMGVDGVNSYLHFFPTAPHLYTPRNWLRLATGTLNGLAMSIIVLPVFNYTLWRKVTRQRVIRGLGELGVLLTIAAVMVYIVQLQPAFLLYPVALLSTLSVLMMLTLVNTMIVLVIIRREAVAETWRDAVLPLALGLVSSLAEISVLNLLRYLVTGSLVMPGL